MEPIKMRHHLNITIPNGSWSICSTIRCIFLAVVLQALLVMRSDEVEGGLPISSTSRSGALARCALASPSSQAEMTASEVSIFLLLGWQTLPTTFAVVWAIF